MALTTSRVISSLQADHQSAAANVVHGFTGENVFFDGQGQVEAVFQQDFVEYIISGAVFFQAVIRCWNDIFQVIEIGIPGFYIAGVEFEDFETEYRDSLFFLCPCYPLEFFHQLFLILFLQTISAMFL